MNAYQTLQQSAWQRLQRELDRWQDEGKTATFWWRDDDACDDCDSLKRLVSLSERCSVPLAIAVIPARLQPGLPTYIANQQQVSVLQHGYAHRSYALSGQKKLELGGSRQLADIQSDLGTGFEQLNEQFGAQFKPVLVPPWNRIDKAVVELLPGIGLQGISTMKARQLRQPAPGVLQVNTHLDPIYWRGGQAFLGDFSAIAILIQHLVGRRCGYRDFDEPTGLLSHHLVQNEAVWNFCARLLQFLSAHAAVEWQQASQIWHLEG